MPAPVSSSTGQLNLARALFASAHADLKGRSADASNASFSSTLQDRLDSPPVAREPGAHLDGTDRPREPERMREPEREPEHANAEQGTSAATRSSAASDPADHAPAAQEGRPANEPGRHDATGPGASDNAARAAQPGGKAADDAAAPEDALADAATDAAVDAAGGSLELIALVVSSQAAASRPDTGGAASDDTAVDAGLPADLAALLPQLAAVRVADGAPGLELPEGDSLDKSLQNSGLLPKMEAGTQGAERGLTNPMVMLQARENMAAAAAGKLAAEVRGVEEAGTASGAGAASPPPGTALPHQVSEFAALRGQAIAARPTPPQLPVNTPVGQDGWAEDVGNRVTWMLGRAESKAELVLTPPNLGKLEVSINLNGDQTTAQFVAANQAARNALEQALPRLREMLAQAGISLGETSVSTSGEQQAGRDHGGDGHGHGRGQGGSSVGGGMATAWLRQHDGMVDTFV